MPPDRWPPDPAPTAVTPPGWGGAHADTTRVIHYALEYAAARRTATPPGEAPARLHRPDPALVADFDLWREVVAEEEARFVLILQTNSREPQRRRAARAYLEALVAAEPALEAEMAYRLPHGSYKVFWLREQAGRWAAVIAHLLPGVEIAHLPPPAPPLTGHQYLHWRTPASFVYPAVAILTRGPNPTVGALLAGVIESGFQAGREGDEGWLSGEALRLWGVCGFLRAAARAHLDALDLCLGEPWAVHATDQGTGDRPRGLPTQDGSGSAPAPLPRPLGSVLEFWALHNLLSLGSGVRRTVAGVRAGTTFVSSRDPATSGAAEAAADEPPPGGFLPFAVFAAAMREVRDRGNPELTAEDGPGDPAAPDAR